MKRIPKKFFHKLSDEEREAAYKQPGVTVRQFVKMYRQPTWCNYPEAITPQWGCWSIASGYIKGIHNCRGCTENREDKAYRKEYNIRNPNQALLNKRRRHQKYPKGRRA